MKLLRGKLWLVIFTILLLIGAAYISSDFYMPRYHFLSKNTVLNINGKKYINMAQTYWYPVSRGKKIGTIKGWEKYRNLTSIFKDTGVYTVKRDNSLKTLILKKPNSEFLMFFHDADVTIPDLKEDDIERIELANGCFPTISHGTTNKSTKNQSIITGFIGLLKKSRKVKNVEGEIYCEKTILLYSRSLPGCVFSVHIWEKDNKYWLEYKNDYIEIENVWINKISDTN